ncbi:hypothetical protein MGG_11887 [Pyricularia oryzae 70-15]|uniref:Rhodopsin domain-containing protein n=1 Tax=Pyricularia oryzae (strain 70-15 / ATCC MYA-4617 / FGSC 8958) TaxID=242507 RepID=G4MKB3_PYRO7|nr:uncharacterized protein MGG_11887 [Pyricularia oryzae 70-15]EHA56704.1 hypothetical protein MGG_11887 [Pyricularia oryzae 70-15]
MKKADTPKTSVNIILQCRPLEFVWNKALPGGECLSVQDLVFSSYFNSAISILTDMILALLPVPMLWRVQMNRRVKASVAGILSLGLFTVAAAFVKVYYIADWGKLGDPLWESTDITIWYTTEISVAIVAGSIPCLKPMFKDILKTASAKRSRRHSYVNFEKQPDASNTTNTGGRQSRAVENGSIKSRTGSHPPHEDHVDIEMWAGPSAPAEGAVGSREELTVADVDMTRPYSDSFVLETSRNTKAPQADAYAVVDKTRRNSIGDMV